jgi:hypothetical protein
MTAMKILNSVIALKLKNNHWLDFGTAGNAFNMRAKLAKSLFQKNADQT